MPSEPLQRWYFVGTSGSGKSSYAQRVADSISVRHFELDATFHQANWQPLETEQFRQRVREFVAEDGWVLDGNYSQVRDLILARAQIIVALDLPKRVVMRQVIARTVRRSWHNVELWNGNREKGSNMFRWNPERSIIRWSWTSHAVVRERMDEIASVARAENTLFLRVHSHAEAIEQIELHLPARAREFLG